MSSSTSAAPIFAMKVSNPGGESGWMTAFWGIVPDIADAAKATTDYECANLAMLGQDFETIHPGATADLVKIN